MKYPLLIAFKPQTVALFAVLTFASTTVVLADLFSPGPNTTDLQGQWIDATTTPPGGPPVYGTPGPADDVDLQGFDITASGGSVQSIYNVGSLSVTGMASAVEASEFTLRGSGTLNVDHVRLNAGLAVVGGHLKATGAGDFVDVSGGGSVTAASCKGGSFRNASSLTLTDTSTRGSASFFSGSKLIALPGLEDFSLTLNTDSTAHVSTYSIATSGSVYINDIGSALVVDNFCRIASGNLAISRGGAATVKGPMLLTGGLGTVDGSGSKLTAIQDLSIIGGDLQMSNGGIGSVMGQLLIPRGHLAVRDVGSVLNVDRFTIGGDPKMAPATVDVDAGAIRGALGNNSKITLEKNGVLNVQDGRPFNRFDYNVSTDEVLVNGGTLNVSNTGFVNIGGLTVENPGQPGRVTISSRGGVVTSSIFNSGIVDVNGDGVMGSDLLYISGHVSVSGDRSLITSKEITISGQVGTSGGALVTSNKGSIVIDSVLKVYLGGVSTANGGTIEIGPYNDIAQDGEIRVHAGGMLRDDGAVTCNSTRILSGGILTGRGTINGKTFNSGSLFPANSPGIFMVQGDYTQNSDGLLGIEIGGTNSGTDYDQLQVSGTATIAGTLQVRLMNGFTPAVGQTYRIVNAGSFSGAFSSIIPPSQVGISVSNDAGGVTVTITSVVAGAPVISSPTTVAATQAQAFSYQITATNNPTSFGAMNLPDGLTINQTSGLISGTPTKAGNYVVPMVANNAAGSGQADLIIGVGFPAVTKPPQLLNISTRMRVLPGDKVLIGGFIVTGTEPKKVIIRGIGPSLSALGLSGALADPTLELHQPDGTVVTNDNWKINAQTGQSQEADIRATAVPPTDDLESALIATLPPGNYSAVLAGKNQTSGIGVVEVYDLGQAANSQLANISSRGFVDTGDNVMIGGFIVGGATGGGNAKVIVRALGPSIPVAGALGNPTLELHDASGTILASNDDWKTRPDGSSQQAEIEATTIPPTNDLESAIVASLPPGSYTAVVRGKNNGTGIGLVEVYELQ